MREAAGTGSLFHPEGGFRFDRASLEQLGFVGWLSFPDARSSDSCPVDGGVYVVTYGGERPVSFNAESKAGRFKGRDPSVSADMLAANWVESEVVYIGKADQLRRRVRQFADFGAGKPVGHWGGRLIWQLAEQDALRIAWRTTPEDIPLSVEARMIAAFRASFGKPPFANDPHRLGF